MFGAGAQTLLEMFLFAKKRGVSQHLGALCSGFLSDFRGNAWEGKLAFADRSGWEARSGSPVIQILLERAARLYLKPRIKSSIADSSQRVSVRNAARRPRPMPSFSGEMCS